MKSRLSLLLLAAMAVGGSGIGAGVSTANMLGDMATTEIAPDIIDMHLHAYAQSGAAPICPGDRPILFVPVDTSQPFGETDAETCDERIPNAADGEALMEDSIAALERHNILAVANGDPATVKRWMSAGPGRIIPALRFSPDMGIDPDDLRAAYRRGEFRVLGEIVAQYSGIGPGDPVFEPYWQMVEEEGIPVALHMGLGPPGTPYLPGLGNYRASLTDPLQLEEVLIRHPGLRIYVMHAGWPMGDEMVHLMYSHPQVYVDIAVLNWALPQAEFYRYLRRLVEAGFGKRIMFGSDQMVWPGAIDIAVKTIREAPFLSKEQKQDIFLNNARRFLRLDH